MLTEIQLNSLTYAFMSSLVFSTTYMHGHNCDKYNIILLILYMYTIRIHIVKYNFHKTIFFFIIVQRVWSPRKVLMIAEESTAAYFYMVRF
jgi:hypothetical protein